MSASRALLGKREPEAKRCPRFGSKIAHSLAVLRLIAREAGTVVMLVAGADEMPEGLSDPERAVAVAEVGHFTLMSAIDVAADPSGRAARSVWKAMTPDTGAAASIFMAHGMAATTARLAEGPNSDLSTQRQVETRALLRAHLPWPEAAEVEIKRLEQSINPLTLDGIEDAEIGVVVGALSRIIGVERSRELPRCAAWFEGDYSPNRYVAGIAWKVFWNAAIPRYLGFADPEGFARAQATRDSR